METKMFGYARVSSKGQNLDRQIVDLLNAGVAERDIFVEKESGGTFQREVYRQLVDIIMREGDCLVVDELHRFGRNYTEIHEEWRYITKVRKMDIKVLDMPLLDTTVAKDLIGTLITDIILALLAYVAHHEREEKKRLQRDGIVAAHKRGVHMGRPRIEFPENWSEVYELWDNKQITTKDAMERLGLKKDSFYKLKKIYEENSNLKKKNTSI